MAHISKGKKFGTIVALVLSIVLAPVLYTGVRYAFFHLGISREFGWSLLRTGHKEIRLRFNFAAQAGKMHRFLSGPLYARAGETLRVSYRISPAEDSTGPLGLNVRPFLSNQWVWHREFDKPTAGTVEIPLKGSRFYVLALGYNFYLGKADVDWSVENK